MEQISEEVNAELANPQSSLIEGPGSIPVAGSADYRAGLQVSDEVGKIIEEMTDEQFNDYLQQAENSEIAEPQPITDDTVAEQTEVSEVQAAPESETEEIGEPQPQDADAPFKVYQSQEEYQSEIDGIFHKRFPNIKEQETLAGELKGLIPYFKDIYGTDDLETIKQRIVNDHAQTMAEAAGVDQDEFKKDFQERISLSNEREELNRLKLEAENQKIIAGWKRETDEVKRIHTDFDFDTECQSNPAFVENLAKGLPVADAYLLANRDKILTSVKQPRVNPNKIGRIPEGNVVSAGTSGTISPEDMTDEQFKKYLKQFEE